MTQKAIVRQLIGASVAHVSLMRQMECGLSCKSCEGCPQKPPDELLATADNSQSNAQPGDVVEVISNSANVYIASLYAFILPCVGLIVGYLLGCLAGFEQTACVAASFVGAFAGFLPALFFQSGKNRDGKPEFTIVRILR